MIIIHRSVHFFFCSELKYWVSGPGSQGAYGTETTQPKEYKSCLGPSEEAEVIRGLPFYQRSCSWFDLPRAICYRLYQILIRSWVDLRWKIKSKKVEVDGPCDEDYDVGGGV